MSWFKRKKKGQAEGDEPVEGQPAQECGRSFQAKDFSDAHTEENLRHFKPIESEPKLPNLKAAMDEGRIDGRNLPPPESRTISPEMFEAEAPTPEPTPEPPKRASVSPPKPQRAPLPTPTTEEETTWAITERGGRLKHTEAEVNKALSLLVLNGGIAKRAAAQLEEEGIIVSADALKKWRDRSFPHRYLKIRKDLSREVGEKVAGDAMEIAQEITDTERAYLEMAMEKVDDVPAEHLAKNVAALAQAKGQNIERAQTLRHEPSEIIETRDVGTMIKELENLKVLKRDNVIDVESEEI